MKQLALNIHFDEIVTFDSFYVAEKNQELVSSLRRFVAPENVAPENVVPENVAPEKTLQKLDDKNPKTKNQPPRELLFYLWGKSGVGKTHLSQAVCHYAGAQGLRVGYLDMSTLSEMGPEVFEGLDRLDLLCWDHLEALFETDTEQKRWNEPLFYLFNRLRDQGTQLLVTAKSNPKHLNIGLNDLESRLAWGLNYHLASLNYVEECEALVFLAAQRGMMVSNLVAEFVLKRIGRKMSEINQVIDQLDAASLSAQRKITIPFVKDFFNW